MICFSSRVQSELDNISALNAQCLFQPCCQLCYHSKVANVKRLVKFVQSKCLVYLHLPWLGTVSTKFEKQITSSVRRCYFAVEPRVVFTTRQLFPVTKKKIYFLLFIVASLFTIICATAIVGT